MIKSELEHITDTNSNLISQIPAQIEILQTQFMDLELKVKQVVTQGQVTGVTNSENVTLNKDEMGVTSGVKKK